MTIQAAETGMSSPAAQAARTRPPIIEALRAGTREAHDRIEHNQVMRRISEPDLDRRHYTLVLQRMLRMHLSLEGRLAELLADNYPALQMDQRRKTPLLRRDLMVLAALSGDLSGSPLLASLAFDQPSAWGTLYVLEGSTLGGRIILRNVERTLGLTADSGAAFYNGYGERTGERWKVFVEEIARVHEAHPEWEAPIVTAASAAFSALDTWLAEAA